MDLHDDDDSRQVTVLTDDERPFVIYGEAERKARRASQRRAAHPDELAAGTVHLSIHGQRHVGRRPGGAVCAFLSAYLMLKGWSLIGDALSHCDRAGRSRRLHAGPAVCDRARFFSGGLAAAAMLFLNAAHQAARRCHHRPDLHSFFALGLFMVSLNADTDQRADHRAGQCPGDHADDLMQLFIICACR
jgi:hypothetical protein